MTLRELIDLASKKLDDIVVPYLWDDDELTQAVNDRINELCEVTGMLRDHSSAFCTIAVTTPTASYTLDDRIIKVLSVKMGTDYEELWPTTREFLGDKYQKWETQTGPPRYFMLDETSKILLYPTPLINTTLRLSVTRYPLVQMNVAYDNLSPEIPWQYHRKLISGILASAYMKDDSETLDVAKAELHEKLWKKAIDDIQQMEANKYYYGTVISPAYGNI